MTVDDHSMELTWTGPYGWPTYEREIGLPSVPEHPGLYLQTYEYEGGYLICAAGITRRPIPTRLREHTPRFTSGDYTVMDVSALKEGLRKEVWHGWSWTPEKRADFQQRRVEIIAAARMQLAAFRLFVANVDPRPRILERLEAAIWNHLYSLPKPLSDIPDRGVMLAARRIAEAPIMVTNRCDSLLHGLPVNLPI
jgi:hypothetical protein